MNKQTKSNIIASTILAVVPFGLFALLLPAGELVAGVAVAAALIGLGVMDLKHEAYSSFTRETPKRSSRKIRLFRFKQHA